ncbi:MAG: hypothetical protein FWH10_01850 [Oscillospiraceae bacterium]|nr:hypothetical protein [Oscillospiraceae bacterium]
MLNRNRTAYNNIRGDIYIMPVIFNVIIHKSVDTDGYYAVCDMPGGGCTVQAGTIYQVQKDMLESVNFYLEDYPEITDYYLKFEV